MPFELSAGASRKSLVQPEVRWRERPPDAGLTRVALSRWSRASVPRPVRETAIHVEDAHTVTMVLRRTRLELLDGDRVVRTGVVPAGAVLLCGPRSRAATAIFFAPFNHFRVWLPQELLKACYEEIHRTAAPAALALFGYEFVRDQVIVDLVRALAAAEDQPGAVAPMFVDGLALALASHLVATRLPPSRLARAAVSRSDAELDGVLEYIDAHLDERLRLDDLRKMAGMGRLRFAERFRKATGLSPYQYVLGQRVSTAKRLLLDPSRTIVDVALSTGFGSQAHFSSAFRRLTGEAPAQWRNSHRVDAPRGPHAAQVADPAPSPTLSSSGADVFPPAWRAEAGGRS